MAGSHTEAGSPGKTQAKLVSAGRVLRLVSPKQFALTAGVAVLLSLTLGSCSGFFINPTISSIFVTPPSSTIAVNNTVQLIATANYSDGSQGTISGTSVGWSSSNTAVATVTSPGGLVTGISTGTATINATSQGVATTAAVTVTPSNITTLSITTTQGSTLPQTTATISGAPATLQFFAYGNGTTQRSDRCRNLDIVKYERSYDQLRSQQRQWVSDKRGGRNYEHHCDYYQHLLRHNRHQQHDSADRTIDI